MRERSRGLVLPVQAAFLIVDEKVTPHVAQIQTGLEKAGFRVAVAQRPSGESQKSLAVAAELYDRLIDLPADRKTLIVAVGGGVIGDLAGFVAATYARGLPLLMVPTTLLAMVDSSVGGKVAVNHPRAKNMIGVFHQPIGVWIDGATLDTLPDREYRSGLAEVVKYGVILNADFFAFLEANVAAILQRNPRPWKKLFCAAASLKPTWFQRTNAKKPACVPSSIMVIPSPTPSRSRPATVAGCTAKRSRPAWPAPVASLSGAGLIAPEITERQIALLKAFSLPTRPEAWPIDALLATMRTDKKSVAGRLRFILPRRLGEVALFDDVPEEEVRNILRESAMD